MAEYSIPAMLYNLLHSAMAVVSRVSRCFLLENSLKNHFRRQNLFANFKFYANTAPLKLLRLSENCIASIFIITSNKCESLCSPTCPERIQMFPKKPRVSSPYLKERVVYISSPITGNLYYKYNKYIISCVLNKTL